jgi:hypothetical protein
MVSWGIDRHKLPMLYDLLYFLFFALSFVVANYTRKFDFFVMDYMRAHFWNV